MSDAPRTVVIGTAGHVDHGKSRLVRALTGTDPDRLAEEKARGLTIDLGFAWRTLPSGHVASFVDVPGHEDFIRNMLAGAGAVSAALLVIAADEGPMPQTREHLAILHLLGIRHGLVVLTKADLVDEDWLALVRADVAALIAPTTLADAPVLAVSAVTGLGMDGLVTALNTLTAAVPPAVDRGRGRLSVDRSFTLAGFGTVVTGTLRDGALAPGDALVLWPAGTRLRARSVQGHGQSVARAAPGTRTAINLPGIEADAVMRGDVVAVPDAYEPTRLVDVALTLLPDAPAPLSHDDQVHVFHGAADIPARVRLMSERALAPGEQGWAQLRLARPTIMAAGDRLVLRRPSPSSTLGGARVLDPHPAAGRRRRFKPDTLARFEALAAGAPDSVVWYMLAEREPCRASTLREPDTGLSAGERDAALARLAAAGQVLALGDLWLTSQYWRTLRGRLESVLGRHHRRYPLRAGPPPEEVRERLGLTPEAFAAVLGRALTEGWVVRSGDALQLPTHEVRFAPTQQSGADALMAQFRAAPFTPPSAKDAEHAVGPEVLAALVAHGDLVAVGGDVLFERTAYQRLQDGVVTHLQTHGTITVAEVRDQFGTSRKYALALLEHLDRARVTRRSGDLRVLAAPGRAASVDQPRP
jgi:selenocysteine-specific elongation factor